MLLTHFIFFNQRLAVFLPSTLISTRTPTATTTPTSQVTRHVGDCDPGEGTGNKVSLPQWKLSFKSVQLEGRVSGGGRVDAMSAALCWGFRSVLQRRVWVLHSTRHSSPISVSLTHKPSTVTLFPPHPSTKSTPFLFRNPRYKSLHSFHSQIRRCWFEFFFSPRLGSGVLTCKPRSGSFRDRRVEGGRVGGRRLPLIATHESTGVCLPTLYFYRNPRVAVCASFCGKSDIDKKRDAILMGGDTFILFFHSLTFESKRTSNLYVLTCRLLLQKLWVVRVGGLVIGVLLWSSN